MAKRKPHALRMLGATFIGEASRSRRSRSQSRSHWVWRWGLGVKIHRALRFTPAAVSTPCPQSPHGHNEDIPPGSPMPPHEIVGMRPPAITSNPGNDKSQNPQQRADHCIPRRYRRRGFPLWQEDGRGEHQQSRKKTADVGAELHPGPTQQRVHHDTGNKSGSAEGRRRHG